MVFESNKIREKFLQISCVLLLKIMAWGGPFEEKIMTLCARAKVFCKYNRPTWYALRWWERESGIHGIFPITSRKRVQIAHWLQERVIPVPFSLLPPSRVPYWEKLYVCFSWFKPSPLSFSSPSSLNSFTILWSVRMWENASDYDLEWDGEREIKLARVPPLLCLQ